MFSAKMRDVSRSSVIFDDENPSFEFDGGLRKNWWKIPRNSLFNLSHTHTQKETSYYLRIYRLSQRGFSGPKTGKDDKENCLIVKKVYLLINVQASGKKGKIYRNTCVVDDI